VPPRVYPAAAAAAAAAAAGLLLVVVQERLMLLPLMLRHLSSWNVNRINYRI
jgi:hypothetical protein